MPTYPSPSWRQAGQRGGWRDERGRGKREEMLVGNKERERERERFLKSMSENKDYTVEEFISHSV